MNREQLGVVLEDWWHVLVRQVGAILGRQEPEAYTELDAPPCGADVVLIPGIWEQWRYLSPLAETLRQAGHPVHVVPELGWNGGDLAASADRVSRSIIDKELSGAVLVAHSKGGLIGKQVMLDPLAGPRVRGMVAVSAPFAGSSLSFAVLRRSPLGMFSPSATGIVTLAAELNVNSRIVSLASSWDEMIPEGSHLAGARNVTLDIAGHFLPVADARVHGMIHRFVHELEGARSMEITAIAAVGRNGAIGRQGDVPWHIPEDWARFKRVTTGCSVIMGRRTFDSIGDPLPGRTSVVVSREPSKVNVKATTPGTRVIPVATIDEALTAADLSHPVWVAGGAEIYRLAWDRLTDLDITEVDQSPEADAFFPAIDPADWDEVSRDQRNGFAFVRYRRRSVP